MQIITGKVGGTTEGKCFPLYTFCIPLPVCAFDTASVPRLASSDSVKNAYYKLAVLLVGNRKCPRSAIAERPLAHIFEFRTYARGGARRHRVQIEQRSYISPV